MSVIRSAEAPIFNVPGFRFTGFASPTRGSSEISSWQIQAEPGAKSEEHSLNHEEIFMLIDGSLTALVNGVESELRAGDALVVPANSLLCLSNPSEKEAKIIACLPVGTQATLANGHETGTPPWAR